MTLTPKQFEVLSFIDEQRSEKGLSPTLAEIGRRFGVSKITAYEHVCELVRKGALKREQGQARSLELLPDGREAMCSGKVRHRPPASLEDLRGTL